MESASPSRPRSFSAQRCGLRERRPLYACGRVYKARFDTTLKYGRRRGATRPLARIRYIGGLTKRTMRKMRPLRSRARLSPAGNRVLQAHCHSNLHLAKKTSANRISSGSKGGAKQSLCQQRTRVRENAGGCTKQSANKTQLCHGRFLHKR